MDYYQPRPKSNKKSRNIKGVHVSGYEDGGIFYVDYIHSIGGKGQVALEELKKDFKKIVVLDPIAEARGFWDKMVERGIVDLLVYSVDFGDGRGEVMVPDADQSSMIESTIMEAGRGLALNPCPLIKGIYLGGHPT